MGIKITKIEANKTRKNLLGRTVSVNRAKQGSTPVSKTRTVTSKNGGVISSKTSYKDSESLAGKMRSNKIDKINRKQFVKNAKEGAKEGAAKTSLSTKRGIKNAVKRNASLNASEEMAQLGMGVSQAAARGAMNAGKVVQRVKSDSKPIMKKTVKEGPVRPIGETVKRVKMDSKPLMEKRVKEGPVKRIGLKVTKK